MSAYTEQGSYNGWKNYETWNVALWISNDESLYNFAKSCRSYTKFVKSLEEFFPGESIAYQTPDQVSWSDSVLDIEALNDLVESL